MRKLFTLASLLIFLVNFIAVSQNNPARWDQVMRLKSLSVNIHADLFTATTFLEMEFFNPREREMEGLYRFSLQPGQVITAFQLELNGTYRDGSIEEKWKAVNAYNTIVGKRIDPALLQFESENNYSLRIYPLPGKGSRKVTITIQQILKANQGFVDYALPFSVRDSIALVKILVQVDKKFVPSIRNGFLAGQSFSSVTDHHELTFVRKNNRLDQPISFSIPLSFQETWVCSKTVGEQTFFALWYKPAIQRKYTIKPASVAVYWDASASAANRDIKREINFLRQYISFNNISQLTIIPFNHKILDTTIFAIAKGTEVGWQNYLSSLQYDGATQFGCLDLSKAKSDIIFVFSDGKNSYGNNYSSPSSTQVYCIHAGGDINHKNLQSIIGQSGGRYINLNTVSFSEAIRSTQQAENLLLDISSNSGKTIIDQELPMMRDDQILITGVMHGTKDNLIFRYGNNDKVKATEEAEIDNRDECTASAVDRLAMLINFKNVTASKDWYNILAFGTKEKVVTSRTSYIVLERVEDYIKFNITPPKELEEQVLPFLIKKDPKQNRENLRQQNILTKRDALLNCYNQRISWWDKSEKPILPGSMASWANQIPQLTQTGQNGFSIESFPTTQFTNGGALLNDVVVIGYATSNRANITGAISILRQNELNGALSVEQALSGRVPGLQIQQSPGFDQRAIINLRGASSLSSNNQPLFVLDGVPVTGDINRLVDMHNVQTIEVIKNPTVALLYGSRVSNGVIIITTKRGMGHRNYSSPRTYKLKNIEDVEYLVEIKRTPVEQKLVKYKELKLTHGNYAGFYFDMAQHLFEAGFSEAAFSVLINAAEISEGNYAVLRAIGYTLENWKHFDEAIKIYKFLVSEYPQDMQSHSDLAMAYYQNGNYKLAAEVMDVALQTEFEYADAGTINTKDVLLNQLNAIISLHTNALDSSSLNPAYIRPLPVDLRIVLESNLGSLAGYVTIIEPGGKRCSLGKPTVQGGRITSDQYYPTVSEYEIKDAVKGKYKIQIDGYYDSGQFNSGVGIPAFIKVTTYKNFGRSNQQITVGNVIMDNQEGSIEIGEVIWK